MQAEVGAPPRRNVHEALAGGVDAIGRILVDPGTHRVGGIREREVRIGDATAVRARAVSDGRAEGVRQHSVVCAVDVLLTDFAMPGINGSETIYRARKINPQLRTILMTGYADERLIPRNNSRIPVLRKPIDLVRVCAAVVGRW